MRIFLKILRYIFIGLITLFILVFFLLWLDQDYGPVNSELESWPDLKPQRTYTADFDSTDYYHLLEQYGQNKTLPTGYEMQALLALAHYPELVDQPIDFIIQEAWIPLSSRPSPWTLLFPWLERRYLVVISSKSIDFLEPILLHNLPFNEQVGVLGHELAHSVYYLDKSALQMTGIAYNYTKASFQKTFERATDKRAIAHGLGFQLYDYAVFVRKAFQQPEKMPESVDEAEDNYLSPQEILEEMKKYPMYQAAEME